MSAARARPRRRPPVPAPVPAPGWAYFLDFDGTLVELAESPQGIRLTDDLRGLIERLSRDSGGALAIVSGRSIADVDRLLPGGLPVAGQHGFERRDGRGRRRAIRLPVAALDRARRRMARLVERHADLVVEDKGGSLALHYRRAPQLAAFAHRSARGIRATLGDRYRLRRGKRVIEIAPAGRNKGTAIEAFMREAPFAGRRPVFIGDDWSDEDGFAAVNRLGGYSVKVGAGPTLARWRLAGVAAVISWLGTGRPRPRPVRRARR